MQPTGSYKWLSSYTIVENYTGVNPPPKADEPPKEETKSCYFWRSVSYSSIQLALREASDLALDSSARSQAIQNLWEAIRKLCSPPRQEQCHLFFDDLIRCLQLGLMDTAENRKMVVRLSHPFDWIDFCRSLPKENKTLDCIEQCELLKGAMAEYTPEVFHNTFSIVAQLEPRLFHYAPYLACSIIGTRSRYSRLLWALREKEPRSKDDRILNQNCFYFYFYKILSQLELRHQVCQFINRYLDYAESIEQKKLLEQFAAKWKIMGWEIDFASLQISSRCMDEVHAVACLYFTVSQLPQLGSISDDVEEKQGYLTFFDATDFTTLFSYLKEARSQETLAREIRKRIFANWNKRVPAYIEEIERLTEEDISFILQIIDPGDMCRDTQTVYHKVLQVLREAKRNPMVDKLQSEFNKIKTEKIKQDQWYWRDES